LFSSPADRVPVPVEALSKWERAATPRGFAEYLVALTGAQAALWVDTDTVYRALGLDCWDITRDANRYPGPGPIIAHPPCGPWGKYRARCDQDEAHGIRAMQLVHQFGGVVEQPEGSTLFTMHGSTGRIEKVFQFHYGHRALKPTLLYIVER